MVLRVPVRMEMIAVSFLKALLLAWVQHRHFQELYADLERMPDSELGALGLGRQEIGRAAFAEAERRAEASLAGRIAPRRRSPRPAVQPST
jgi:hypothetical protein